MDLVTRVKGIILTPRKEWSVIDGESTTVNALYTGYIVPLAAIPAIAGFIGYSLIGGAAFGTITAGIARAIVRFVLALLGTYVLALIIDGLAPTFGGQKSKLQALKVAAYSSTAIWLAGIFTILPSLSPLAILGLYSLFLLFVGLPIVMKAPAEKALGYVVVVIVCDIVLFVVLASITTAIVGTAAVIGAAARP